MIPLPRKAGVFCLRKTTIIFIKNNNIIVFVKKFFTFDFTNHTHTPLIPAEKSSTAGINPTGMGVIRFKVWDMLKQATHPITAGLLIKKLTAEDMPITPKTARIILRELQRVNPENSVIITQQVRAGRSRATGYIINKRKTQS